MEKKNIGMKVTIVILGLLVVGLVGFILYDKVFNIDKDNNNDTILFSYNDFSETVFSDDSGNYYLILWNNGTYSYNNTIGNYTIENSNIILNYIFNNGSLVSEKNQIKLEINSLTELKDTSSNVKLNKVNHPTSPGGEDFYNIIDSYKDNTNNNSVICENNNDFQVDYSKLTDMGTGISIKSISSSNYQLSISSNGKLTYLNKENGTKGNINIKNVVDVEYNQYAGELNGEYFILTTDGQLYTITEKNMNSDVFEPIKDVTLGKVIKIGSFSTCKPNAGCGWGIYCVTADGNTKQLAFQSV